MCQGQNLQKLLRQHLGLVLLPLTLSYFFACPFQPRPRALTRPHARQHQEAFVCEIDDSEESDEEEAPSCPAWQSLSPRSTRRRGGCCRWFKKYLCVVRSCKGGIWQQGRLFIHIYRLDNYSRVVFPVSFFFFNVLYWLVCLNL